jgi:hypothetical protein
MGNWRLDMGSVASAQLLTSLESLALSFPPTWGSLLGLEPGARSQQTAGWAGRCESNKHRTLGRGAVGPRAGRGLGWSRPCCLCFCRGVFNSAVIYPFIYK